MKVHTLRNWGILLLSVLMFGMTSCSKETVDNIGRDTALNIIRTGTWSSWVKTVAGSSIPELNVTTQMLADGETLNFDKDGAWHKKNGGTAVSHSYSMPTAKSMIFDGVTYDIQENIVGSITTLTLVNKNQAVTTTMIFKRTK